MAYASASVRILRATARDAPILGRDRRDVVARDAAVFAWNGSQLVPTGGQARLVNADARTSWPFDALVLQATASWSPTVGNLSANDRPVAPA